MAETILAIVSDTHIGSTTALSLPEFITDEGQTIRATKAQDWLYACWMDYWQYVRELAGIRGRRLARRLVIVHLGDVVDGNHHGTVQALPNLEDQENMACELLRPLAAMADGGYYQIRGTEAHAGAGAQSEVRVARATVDIRHRGAGRRAGARPRARGVARTALRLARASSHG